MSDARMAAGVEASALIRIVEAQGGFGAVLHKGDAERGALLLVITERGRLHTLLARQYDGLRYAWTAVPVDCSDSANAHLFLEKRTRNDPDEWHIELDTPLAQRLVAELTAEG